MNEFGVVAIDLGASSGRFAAGQLEGSKFSWSVIQQVPHNSIEVNGQATWDMDALVGLCKSAVDYAEQNFQYSAVGIDTWGVDIGLLDSGGQLAHPVVCYRDISHQKQFEKFAGHRKELFQLTGIAHQPFNTIYQLAARKEENPLLAETTQFLLLPDLLGKLIGGYNHYESTICSTTQLMGLDGDWAKEAFDLVGWETPEMQPARPGWLGQSIRSHVYLAHVPAHDTAAAVVGLGDMDPDEAFLNIGTWSLLGVVRNHPIVTTEAESHGFTNERGAKGDFRFLKNVPGFYIINRLYQDLGISAPIQDWIATAERPSQTVDFMDSALYNPASMAQAVSQLSPTPLVSEKDWASLAVWSLAETIAKEFASLQALHGQPLRKLRVGGGGSQSSVICQAICSCVNVPLRSGPAEATVLGNMLFSAKAMASAWDPGPKARAMIPFLQGDLLERIHDTCQPETTFQP